MLEVEEQRAGSRLPSPTDRETEPAPGAGETGRFEQPSCPNCSAIGSAGEGFCTSCGLPFDVFATPASDERVLPLMVGVPGRGSPLMRKLGGSRRVSIVTAISLLVLGLIIAVALFATAWHQQTARKRAAEASLSTTRSQLGATQERLRQSQVLLARQQTILKQTAAVLRKVDPLLSGADHLQQITTQIQSARDTFASDSSQMTSDLVYLENVVANPAQYPGVDQFPLVSQVNGELATVGSDFSTLASYDSNYSDASSTFGTTATALTTAVRKLQHELRGLSTPGSSTP